jgi:sphingolipid 4-desaturase/C4-monooxygenase
MKRRDVGGAAFHERVAAVNHVAFNRPVDTDDRFHAGESIWAWRNGDFFRATVVAADGSLEPSDPKSPVYRVAFEDPAEPSAEFPASLMRRQGCEKPGLVAPHEWHSRRRKMILHAHPEIRKLKPLPGLAYSAMMLILILLHLGVGGAIAVYTGAGPNWLWAIALSATMGAFFAYALQQLTHEICHTSYRRLNRGLVLLGDFIVGTTGPCYFSYYFHLHITHHAKTGDVGDPDIRFHGHWSVPPKWLARSRVRRFVWLTLVSLFTFEILILEHLVGRVPQPGRLSIRNKALVAALVGKYGFMLATFWLGGVWCFLYFRLAAGFSLGAFGHPYAGFWLMQHAATSRNGFQPTLSYAGSRLWHWLNLGELYHVEHHDFPWVPFTKIGAVRQIAPEYYRCLYVVPSVWRLIWGWMSHTDGSPWMDVAGVLNCLGPPMSQNDKRRRPTPSLTYGDEEFQ